MKVHLIKSNEVDREMFTRVVDILQSVPGPIKFYFDSDAVIDFDKEEYEPVTFNEKESFEKQIVYHSISETNYSRKFPLEIHTLSWKALFEKCNEYRNNHSIASDSFVLLLTDISNKNNWFACLDENMPYNGFIHTADWNEYIECSPEFPVAYEIVALILQKYMFNGHHELREMVHMQPMGCVNDFCLNKREIILKLRTADICKKCYDKIKIDLPQEIIRHALDIMSSLRERMLFAQNFRQLTPLSKIKVSHRLEFTLPGFNNIRVQMTPLQKVMYALFLRHPDGIYMSHLNNHYDELLSLYGKVATTDSRGQQERRIADLTNYLSANASQQLSRIKRTITNLIGEDLAQHYIIKGPNGEKKKIDIAMEVEMVEWG